MRALALALALSSATAAGAAEVTPTWYVLDGDGKLVLYLPSGDGVSGMRGDLAGVSSEKVRAFVVMPDRRVVFCSGDKLVAHDGRAARRVPGRWDDLTHLTLAGARLVAATKAHEVVAVDLASGKRTVLAKLDGDIAFLTADGELPLALHGGKIEEISAATPRKTFPVSGRPLALAAAQGHIFYAVREGVLYQIDRDSGKQRDLGLGNWVATAAMHARAQHLYVATRAGKLWDVDYGAGTKAGVATHGWELTTAIVVVPAK